MATQLKKTVKPSGGDYPSLEACMHANEQDLVAEDKYFDVEIDGSWSSPDTTAVTIHNYTTDATHYINIYTTSAARHNGKLGSNYYVLTVASGNALSILQDSLYITIDGLIVTVPNGTSNPTAINLGYLKSNIFATLKNCIIPMASSVTDTTNSPTGVYFGNSGTTNIYNNILYNIRGGANNPNTGSGVWLSDGNGTVNAYNNTVYNCYNGIYRQSSETMIVKNNLSYNNTTDFVGSFDASSDYNFSKDDTAPEAAGHSIWGTTDGKTPDFVNVGAGTEDFHLQSTSDAIDVGVDLSGTFTTDIDGTTRSGTWDIGADEYVGGTTPTGFMTLNSRFWGT